MDRIQTEPQNAMRTRLVLTGCVLVLALVGDWPKAPQVLASGLRDPVSPRSDHGRHAWPVGRPLSQALSQC